MICSAVYRFLANLDIFPLYPIDHDTYSAAGLVYAGVGYSGEGNDPRGVSRRVTFGVLFRN
jgi:hypothetical protein